MTKILVVEDNAASRKLFGEILRKAGYDAYLASTADDAIAHALADSYDLILMDIQLPGTDGLTATTMLRSIPTTANIPIIAITAHAMRGDEKRILDAGCDSYLPKPVSYRELLAEVERLIRDGRPSL